MAIAIDRKVASGLEFLQKPPAGKLVKSTEQSTFVTGETLPDKIKKQLDIALAAVGAVKAALNSGAAALNGTFNGCQAGHAAVEEALGEARKQDTETGRRLVTAIQLVDTKFAAMIKAKNAYVTVGANTFGVVFDGNRKAQESLVTALSELETAFRTQVGLVLPSASK